MRMILHQMNIPQKGPTPLYCGNQSTIKRIHNLADHQKYKHAHLWMHYIYHLYALGCIAPIFVLLANQLVDIFTKILLGSTFTSLWHCIGVGDFSFRGDVML